MLAHLFSGGYPTAERRISARVRKTVIFRDQGRCQICGRPGTEIDHIDGTSNDPSNLQVLCIKCHNQKTDSHIKKVSPNDPRFQEIDQKGWELEARVHADKPLRECDDPERWSERWREILQERELELYEKMKPILIE